jgi:diguanylate cyclase (GGDEF)-like protein
VHFKFLQERDVENAYHQAIHEMMVRDGLTQTANKRKYEEEAVREVARAKRYGRPLSLILFDIDGFKTVNDAQGHLCGDFVLKEVVYLVSDFFRKEQTFARVGGDEFAVLTCRRRARTARGFLAERLRGAGGESRVFPTGACPSAMTCSFGVAEYHADMKGTQDLFECGRSRSLSGPKPRGSQRRRGVHYRPTEEPERLLPSAPACLPP